VFLLLLKSYEIEAPYIPHCHYSAVSDGQGGRCSAVLFHSINYITSGIPLTERKTARGSNQEAEARNQKFKS